MKKRNILLGAPAACCIALALASCSNDAYDSGDSGYSFLRTDFVTAYTNAKAQVCSAITDDGDSLVLQQPASVAWAVRPDTAYRALLYYNLDGDDKEKTPLTVGLVSMSKVFELKPAEADASAPLAYDPVYFQSSWLSNNGRYANIGLDLMTGKPDNMDAVQKIALVRRKVVTDWQGHRTVYCKLAHDQGEVPEYYKVTVYVSIPTAGMKSGDKLVVDINTYDGTIRKTFRL